METNTGGGSGEETVRADMAALLGPTAAPTVVAGRYLLHRVVGTGGAAVVHEATDTLLDRRVAVKLLREGVGDDTDRARFLSEARLLASLSHPRLVRVLDAGIDGERPYLVLELVTGRTLADALDDGLTRARVATVGAEVATALAHVHAAGIVHRDVKPGNVLLSETGAAKLADFGIARLVDDTRHHTRTGTLVGTVAYLAPEQVAGEPATTAVDVYAWGLVLLEAVTGARAYEGSSVESALARLTRQPEVPRTLPEGWRRLLVAMTAREPAARPTAAQVAERLRRLADEPAAYAASPGLSPRVVAGALVAALALLIGVAAWPALTGSGDSTAVAAPRTPAPRVLAGPDDAVPAADPTEVAAALPDAVPAAAASTTASAPHRSASHHRAHHRHKHHKHKHHKHKHRGHKHKHRHHKHH